MLGLGPIGGDAIATGETPRPPAPEPTPQPIPAEDEPADDAEA